MFTKGQYDVLSDDHKAIIDAMHKLFGGQSSITEFFEVRAMRLLNADTWSRPAEADIVRKFHLLYETAAKLSGYADIVIVVEPSRTDFTTIAVHKGMDTLLQTIHAQEDLTTFGNLGDLALYVEYLTRSMMEVCAAKGLKPSNKN